LGAGCLGIGSAGRFGFLSGTLTCRFVRAVVFSHSQSDTLARDINFRHPNANYIARFYDLVRIFYKSIRELADMDQSVLVNTDINERSKSGNVGDRAF